METVNASHFKTHFGEILNLAIDKPVRVKRRGQPATVLLSEEEYEQLTRQSREAQKSRKSSALENLQAWINAPVDHKDASDDLRADAILAKHGKHWD